VSFELVVSLLCLSVVFLACGSAAGGTVIRIQPGQSIQAAMDKAQPGDTVRLASGEYFEQVGFVSGGTTDRPITLEGEPGAVIYGHDTGWRPQWRPAKGFTDGVWATPCPYAPASVEADGHYMEGFDAMRACPKDVFAQGGPRTGWEVIHGTWCFVPADGQRPNSPGVLYLYWAGKDPRRFETFRIAPDQSACVTIDGADHCVVRGLDLRASEHGVLLTNTRGSVVTYCTVGPTTHGIRLYAEAHGCTVRRCEAHCIPSVWDWTTPGGTEQWSDLYWLTKKIGFNNRRSISLFQSGDDNVIAYNTIHHCYQGPEDKDLRGGRNHTNLEVHHNRVTDAHAYGYAPNSSAINQRWHHNLAARASTSAMRVKRCRIGPLFIYRNVFADCRISATWVYSAPGETYRATVFIYHNTFSKRAGSAYVVYVHNNALKAGLPHVYMRANLYYFPDEPLGCYKENRIAEYHWTPQHFDANVIPAASQKQLDSNRGDLPAWNPHGRTYPKAERPFDEKFTPTADSPARDLPGRRDEFYEYLRTVPGVELPADGAFPGLDTFTGSAPDAGAREYDPQGTLGEDNRIGVDPRTVGAYADRPESPPPQ